MEQQCLDKLTEMNEHVSRIQPFNPITLSSFGTFCPCSLIRDEWTRRCSTEFHSVYKGKLYLFSSESNRNHFLSFPEAYSNFSKNQIKGMIKKCSRIFANPGFGNGVQKYLSKKANQWGLGVIDLVPEVVNEIKRRVSRLLKKISGLRGFEEPDEDQIEDLISEWLESKRDQNNLSNFQPVDPNSDLITPGNTTMPVIKAKTIESKGNLKTKSNDEFGAIMTKNPEAENPDAPDENEDQIFAPNADFENLALSLEDLETSREELEEQAFKAVLARSKGCLIFIRNQLRDHEPASLSREPMEILQKIEKIPDHVMMLYVSEKTAVQNVFDEERLKKYLEEKRKEREEIETKLLTEAIEKEKEERRKEKEAEMSEEEGDETALKESHRADDFSITSTFQNILILTYFKYKI